MTKETMEPLIPSAGSSRIDAATRRGRIQMILLLLVCALPVIASYFTFYVLKPQGGKANIGKFVSPAQPFPTQTVQEPIVGKWTLLVARSARDCRVGQEKCVSLLYLMRQVKVAMGKESQRVQLVWIVTDNQPVDPEIDAAYDKERAGFLKIHMPDDPKKREELLVWLNRDGLGESIHLLDPYGDRMMRFDTKEGAPDFKKVTKDMEKLLKWNPTGKVGS